VRTYYDQEVEWRCFGARQSFSLRSDKLSGHVLRVLSSFPEPDFTLLRTAAFSKFGVQSRMLSEVLVEEAGRRPQAPSRDARGTEELRIGAFVEDRIVGWSYSQAEGRDLHMINSGVSPDYRHRGIYREIVAMTIDHAERQGFVKIVSRHVPSNNDVIIPKLRLGFVISAFEYSEVYGPLIHLTYLISSERRQLYQARSTPIVPAQGEAQGSS